MGAVRLWFWVIVGMPAGIAGDLAGCCVLGGGRLLLVGSLLGSYCSGAFITLLLIMKSYHHDGVVSMALQGDLCTKPLPNAEIISHKKTL